MDRQRAAARASIVDLRPATMRACSAARAYMNRLHRNGDGERWALQSRAQRAKSSLIATTHQHLHTACAGLRDKEKTQHLTLKRTLDLSPPAWELDPSSPFQAETPDP